jgi:hypothetical protein
MAPSTDRLFFTDQAAHYAFADLKQLSVSTLYWSGAGVDFNEFIAVLLTIDPWLPTVAMGQPDRKSLRLVTLPMHSLKL